MSILRRSRERGPRARQTLATLKDAWAVLGRAIDTKPTGDIGQTAAASQIVKSGAGFEGLNLDGLFLSGANLTDANFRKVHAAGALLTRSSLGKANFTDATMPFINLTDASAEGANLENTYLPYADADRVVLQNAELSRANWFGASLKGADLGGRILGSEPCPRGLTRCRFAEGRPDERRLVRRGDERCQAGRSDFPEHGYRIRGRDRPATR